MNTYKTNEVAQIIGIHANTVRLYESCGLIPQPVRRSNGYRVFTDLHIEQFRLARAALQVEVLQNGLRKKAVQIIKCSAACRFEEAESLTAAYIRQLDQERANAEEALAITRQLLDTGNAGGAESTHFLSAAAGLRAAAAELPAAAIHPTSPPALLSRQETARCLGVTIDTLRNWELNGLLTVKRRQNGYRVYTQEDLRRLKIIRSLRCANYSLASILRMLGALDQNPSIDIRRAIDTPSREDDIITACDHLLTSLSAARENALFVISQIRKMSALPQ